MKRGLYTFLILTIVFSACRDNNINLFDKTADERAAEAIANLKSDLIAPAKGWKMKYTPEPGSGSYYLLMNFDADNKVTIKSDLGVNNGEFFEQTLTYRIDNSLGLELIFETYSFFSYLFEQDQATFGAEYEWVFVNKTPDDNLVFRSKTDAATPTIMVFEKAQDTDDALFGRTLSVNLDKFSSGSKLSYLDKDVDVYLTMNSLKRTMDFNYISPKDNTSAGKAVSLSTGYVVQGDSLILETPFSASLNGTDILIHSLILTDVSEISLDICPSPKTIPQYKGVTSAGDPVTLENSLFSYEGATFKDRTQIYYMDIGNVFDENGSRVNTQIAQDIAGAQAMLIYNNYKGLNGIGFYIGNSDGTDAIVVREDISTFNGNIVDVEFTTDVKFVRGTTNANIENINIYLNKLTEGGKMYVYKYDDQFYKISNPCSGWDFFFQVIDL
jgi:hypothetical protein